MISRWFRWFRRPQPSRAAREAIEEAEAAHQAMREQEKEGKVLREALRAQIAANNFDLMLARTLKGRRT